MAVKRYEVDYETSKGRTVKTTLKLNDADAKRLGLLKESQTKKATPSNKARTASNKKA